MREEVCSILFATLMAIIFIDGILFAFNCPGWIVLVTDMICLPVLFMIGISGI